MSRRRGRRRARKTPGVRDTRKGYLGALGAAVTGNAQAFGFSIAITASYGAVSLEQGDPSPAELLGFAVAAVLAFSVLQLAAAALTPESGPAPERRRVTLVATATDFLAVGLAVGVALGLSAVLGGFVAWALPGFAASAVYLLVQAVELLVAAKAADADAD